MSSQIEGLMAVVLDAVRLRMAEIDGRIEELDTLMGESVVNTPALALARSLGLRIEDPYPELPTPRKAFSIPPMPHTVLLVPLAFGESDIPNYQAALWWIALVHARLSPKQRADLYAIFVADASVVHGSARRKWLGQIERDDRFCRKYVFCGEDVQPLQSATDFLDRTFLARPWSVWGHKEARSLDPLAGILGRLSTNPLLSGSEAQQWLELLESSAGDGAEIAAGLLDVLEKTT